MKRRTRKQWYKYHLEKSKDAARSEVLGLYEPKIRAAHAAYCDLLSQLSDAKSAEPWRSWIVSWVGIETDYRRSTIRILECELRRAHRTLNDARTRQDEALREASRDAATDFLRTHELRKAEAAARAARVAARRHEQRISYLERSPAIRSAARFLKRILLGESATEASEVVCFYCKESFPRNEVHLEHKRPICRGGDNSRSNLVLSCAACNLKKGRKTHEEFLRDFAGSDAAQ